MSNSFSSKWKILREELKKLLTRNWGYKLLSLFLAAVIWSVLIAQDPTITREKTIPDVTLTVSGTDNMKRNGFIVTNDLSDQIQDVTIRASVPQMQYQTVSAANFVPRIDLSRVRSAGTQQVRILTTNSSSYGTVLEVTPASVTLEVEEYITRNRIPIVRETVGEMADGWYTTSTTLDPTTLTVSGPRSIVESVVRAEVVQDLSTVPAAEGVQRSALSFRLVDQQNQTVESDLLEVTSMSVLVDSVIAEQTVYPTKLLTFSQTGVITGVPAEGDEVKSVTFSPDKIRVAGRADTLENLDSIFTDLTVDVTGRKESFTQNVRLRRPSELVYMSQDSVTVSVEIGEVISEKVFTDVRINVTGAEANLSAVLEERYADIVTVQGPLNWLNSLKGSQLLLRVDAAGLTEEGTYELPVLCEISGDDGQEYTVKTSPSAVTLTVRSK